jgi:BASS family bile acid:Na+ symporter
VTSIFQQLLILFSRHARPLLAAGVFLGILLPDVAQMLRPFVTPAVIGTLTGALLRLDWLRLRSLLQQPLLVAQLTFWQLVLSPLLVWLATVVTGLPPALGLALILQAAAPPIGSAAVFVMLLELDASLAMVATVAAVLLLPFTLTPLVALLADSTLQIDLLAFFLRVTLLVMIPFLLAWLLRRLLGNERLSRYDGEIGGLNVILLVIFAIGVMDGVTQRLLSDPGFVGGLLLLACLSALVLHLAAYFAFARSGLNTAVSAAVCSGNRNMGLMLAITAGSAGPAFSLYVGVAQIPMYFMPLLINFCLRRCAVNRNINP